jgi:hypothetical protein
MFGWLFWVHARLNLGGFWGCGGLHAWLFLHAWLNLASCGLHARLNLGSCGLHARLNLEFLTRLVEFGELWATILAFLTRLVEFGMSYTPG